MMARMLRIEYLLGRKDKNLHKPRTVDIDLLMFGSTQTETEFLTLPHPRMHLRRFVLTPLAEIAPHAQHPVSGKNITQLLADLSDNSFVKRWNPNSGQTFENDEMKIYFKNLTREVGISEK
jgi:2-amino-4-hydroxy-6-hydroxymethyldihydropteridine diphosphokinase